MGLDEIPPPWQHQVEVRQKAGDQFALFWEMGTGKSRAMIDILRDRYNRAKRIERTLILAPLLVVPNWKAEFLKYSKISPAQVVILEGSILRRKREWEHANEKFRGNFIVVTNYDKLVTTQDVPGWLSEWAPEVLVLDESHRCKDRESKRTKAVLRLARPRQNPSIRARYILSGTPILRDPLDLFAQFLILDDGKTFGDQFWNFKLAHMVDKNAHWKGKPNYFPKWEMRPGSSNIINAQIQAKSMRVTKAECLDLPPLVRERRYVGMTVEQARVYKEMKRDFIAFINEKTSVAALALTKALRLLQIASGYVQADDGVQVKLKNTPKQEALKELLQELTPDHKVLVWSVFKENYAQIRQVCDELGIGYVEVNGDCSSFEKQEAIRRLREDPTVRVMSGNPDSGGIGVNMTAASYSIFYSRNFSLEASLQAEARNHRGGSEIHERITRIDLVCQGTIDELALERIEMKEQISEATIRRLADHLASEDF